MALWRRQRGQCFGWRFQNRDVAQIPCTDGRGRAGCFLREYEGGGIVWPYLQRLGDWRIMASLSSQTDKDVTVTAGENDWCNEGNGGL